ncbi:type I 3-dehydroquinate dehydratase [Trichococcus ilyis]|jgi:3-dehydroquinate dehydratase-1|uniref:3-dehydroquinate dehydratase n=1 Tax=Trichococcus ilyis TaxID=640938 RepID=A0A143YIN1_9LACT|nr:type I 3-dehydroquinate dehydratase [Trichococcus ilyis]CZQ89861.1 3-dehydroquinate dehydratase type i [Trichococcus ilyis]SEI82120.1 3-dehydroquinate dehydratase [Trichococcus ilyis]
MGTVQVKDVVFNEGRPKICVPLVGKTKQEIIADVKMLGNVAYDLAELRIDCFDGVEQPEQVEILLAEINSIHKKPLLFTFRTKKEGGERELSMERYFELVRLAIRSGRVDLVDLELFSSEEEVIKLISEAREKNVKVILSSHDFFRTPPKEEIVARLVKMQELGADITKIAVMPQSEEDVLTLLAATLEMKKVKADRPCITMSMGKYGVISRLAGELFGSCLTFAAAKEVSAPGQVSVRDVRSILDILALD